MIHHPRSGRHHAATEAVLEWYAHHGRVLPWRAPMGECADPYSVWLSEIMLQQTTVAVVKGYFDAFTSRWPNVEALAAAPRADVLAAWAGLGYYARARNLHAAAVCVAREYGGQFPATEAELRRLPGVGAYTAAAIAAFAFGERAVVVDGNIERVTARWQAITTPLPGAKPELRAVMDALTPDECPKNSDGKRGGNSDGKRGGNSDGKRDGKKGGKGGRNRAGDFAQAMMDIGALICTPSRSTAPDCTNCPLAKTCLGRHQNPERLPIKAAKKPRPHRLGVVAVITDTAGRVVLEERPDRGLLGGMLVFPGSDWADGSPHKKHYPLKPDMPVMGLLGNASGGASKPASRRTEASPQVQHVFTHFALTLTIEEAVISSECPLPPGYRWVEGQDLMRLALPSVMRKVAVAVGML